MSVDVLTVSSKGQVVLPATMRRKLSITSGSKLAAYTAGSVIVLKVIEVPTGSDFKAMLYEAELRAKEAGYVEEDVGDIVKAVKARKRLKDTLL